MTKFGDWSKAGTVLRNLNPKIKEFSEKRLREDSQQFVDALQNKIDTQVFYKRYPELAESTVRLKNSEDFYRHHRDLRDGFTARKVRSSENQITMFAGASPWKRHPSGLSMSDLMLTLEYGNHHIPPRPLIRPTWDSMEQEIIQKWRAMEEEVIVGGG